MSSDWHVPGWFDEAERAAAFAQRLAWMKAELARESRDKRDAFADVDQRVAADFAAVARKLYGIAHPMANVVRDS